MKQQNVYDSAGVLRYHVSTMLIQGMWETCLFREFGTRGSQVISRTHGRDHALTAHIAAVQALNFTLGKSED